MGALGAVSAVVGNGEGRVHKEYNDTTLWEVLCYQHSQQPELFSSALSGSKQICTGEARGRGVEFV